MIVFVACQRPQKGTTAYDSIRASVDTSMAEMVSDEHKPEKDNLRILLDTGKVDISTKTSIVIKSIKKTINLTDRNAYSARCNDWMLDSADIVNVMHHSHSIDQTEFSYLYYVLPCEINGLVLVDGKKYLYKVNGGSFFSIVTRDAEFYFGCSADVCSQWFVETGGDVKRDLDVQ